MGRYVMIDPLSSLVSDDANTSSLTVELFSELNCWGDSIYIDTPNACETTASGAVLQSWRLVRT